MRGSKLGSGVFISLLAVVVFSLAFSSWSNPQIAPVKTASNNANPWIVKTGDTIIAADQGGAELKPENTMKAYKQTVTKSSAKMIKTDVRATKDGVVVACRPYVINGISDVKSKTDDRFAKVEEYTYSELCKLNFGYKFRDVSWDKPYYDIEGSVPNDLKIVRLSELLDYLKSYSDMRIMIEFRESGNEAHATADAVCNMLKNRNMASKAILKASDISMSKYIEFRYPEIARTANTFETVKFYFMCQFERDMSNKPAKYKAVVLPQRFGLVTLTTQKLVNYAHSYNIAVQYDSVNNDSKIEYLKSIGADAVITESPALSDSK